MTLYTKPHAHVNIGELVVDDSHIPIIMKDLYQSVREISTGSGMPVAAILGILLMKHEQELTKPIGRHL